MGSNISHQFKFKKEEREDRDKYYFHIILPAIISSFQIKPMFRFALNKKSYIFIYTHKYLFLQLSCQYHNLFWAFGNMHIDTFEKASMTLKIIVRLISESSWVLTHVSIDVQAPSCSREPFNIFNYFMRAMTWRRLGRSQWYNLEFSKPIWFFSRLSFSLYMWHSVFKILLSLLFTYMIFVH